MSFRQNLIDRLPYVGFFALGAYIGGVMNYGIQHINSLEDFSTNITLILSSVFAGSVFVFLQFMADEKFTSSDKKAIYAYPIGLICALLWLQAKKVTETLGTNIQKIVMVFLVVVIISIILYVIISFLRSKAIEPK